MISTSSRTANSLLLSTESFSQSAVKMAVPELILRGIQTDESVHSKYQAKRITIIMKHTSNN